jgi:hypothetical protein
MFEATLGELGIGYSNEPDSPRWLRHECAAGNMSRDVIDHNTHIVNYLNIYDPLNRAISHNWSSFTYGSKLFNVTTVNDPELQKLMTLFEWLVVPPDNPSYEDLFDQLGFQ